MTKEIVYCDRCGNEIQYPIQAHYRLYKGGKDERIDLCQSCIDSLGNWLHDSLSTQKESLTK